MRMLAPRATAPSDRSRCGRRRPRWASRAGARDALGPVAPGRVAPQKVALGLLTLGLLTLGLRMPSPAQDAPAPPRDAESRLWATIVALRDPGPATQPFSDWFDQALSRAAARRAALHSYLTIYPGGRHRDEAIALELETLFELATLQSRPPDELRQRLAELQRNPPSRAARHEAAYWELICRRYDAPPSTAPASQPTPAEVRGPDADLLAAMREYLRLYPDSRHSPRLTHELFQEAQLRGDVDALRGLAAYAQEHFPQHMIAAELAARVRREDALGRPFVLRFTDADGREIDTAAARGRPALVVVWAGFDEAARRCVQAVERFRRDNPQFRVLGVSLDESRAALAAAARELDIDWPQYFDGLGWGHAFVRAWGVLRIPTVFVIDADGRLVGVTGGDRWLDLARDVLRRPHPASDERPPAAATQPGAAPPSADATPPQR